MEVSKKRCLDVSKVIESARVALEDRKHECVQAYMLSQEFFRKRVDDGWRFTEERIVELIILQTTLTDRGYVYRVSELFNDVQG